MIPEPIFGFIHMYGLMIGIGVLVAFSLLEKYGKKVGLSQKMLDFAFYDIFVAIIVGFGSAAFFQAFYLFIKYPENGFHFNGEITFLGGLIGGFISFFVGYAIFRKKIPDRLSKLMTVVPCLITVAHGFGRIGCFFAGCCYGKPTDSWLGVQFPFLSYKVHPTQLYEAFFLFVLFAVLSVRLYKGKEKYNFPIYFIAYGVFRFLIEYIRGDERGAFIGNLSPSQFWSLVMVVIGVALIFIIKNRKPEEDEEPAAEEESSEESADEETDNAEESASEAEADEASEEPAPEAEAADASEEPTPEAEASDVSEETAEESEPSATEDAPEEEVTEVPESEEQK